ncbi:MAG: DUF6655 family protein [Planctomycetota bacterium]
MKQCMDAGTFAQVILVSLLAGTLVGCATSKSSHTARTASEQLLISSAIDRSLSKVRFTDFAGKSVFINDKYLEGVDKGYLMGTLRHRVLQGGGKLVESADKADCVVEARSGGIGTDSQESFVGVPALGIPGLPIELPEIKVASRATQMGTAKIALACYDAKTGESMGSGGKSTALTHNSDTYVFGVGPFRSGAVLQQRQSAIGFEGVGGSLTGGSRTVAAQAPIEMVRQGSENGLPTPLGIGSGATGLADAKSVGAGNRPSFLGSQAFPDGSAATGSHVTGSTGGGSIANLPGQATSRK